MTKPFSVSLSVYQNDDSNNFKAAFLSIINQTLLPSEIILVIDGPIPIETRKIISDFELNYKFLKVIDLKQNQGHGNARRIGLNKCTNEIIALMDSDDISVHNRFELQYNFLANNPEVSLVGGQIEEFIDDIDNIVLIGPITNVNSSSNTLTIDQPAGQAPPSSSDFIMFSKDNRANASGLLGYYAKVKFINDSKDKIELFAVGSEVFESSK